MSKPRVVEVLRQGEGIVEVTDQGSRLWTPKGPRIAKETRPVTLRHASGAVFETNLSDRAIPEWTARGWTVESRGELW